MTALAGFWALDGRPSQPSLDQVLNGQRAYGSQLALATEGETSLGRLLFATLPEDRFDRTVLRWGSNAVIADVRLDNREELADQLGLRGHSSRSDSDILAACLARWGREAVQRFVGEFAFIWWDGSAQKLIIARDHLGFRPLHFHRGRNFVAVTSMPSGLHSLAEVPYRLDKNFILESVALLPRVGSSTHFAGIERVVPGHLIEITRTATTSCRYWRPTAPPTSSKSLADVRGGLREVVEQAVKAHSRTTADVLGTHLSSGLDSAIVTATAAQMLPAQKIRAFTAVPPKGADWPTPAGTYADEGPLAALVTERFPNIEHVLVESCSVSPLEGMQRDFVMQQQPGDNICNATWGREINRQAKRSGVGVILTAGAGNMTISYAGWEGLSELLGHGRVFRLASLILSLKKNGSSWQSLAGHSIAPFLPATGWRSLVRLRNGSSSFQQYAAVPAGRTDRIRARATDRGFDLAYQPSQNSFMARLSALQRHDGGNFYKGMIGEWGISLRDPTADKRVVEYCLKLQGHEFLRGGRPRSLARDAFNDRLPVALLSEKRRGYQSADWLSALQMDSENIQSEIRRLADVPEIDEMLDVQWLESSSKGISGANATIDGSEDQLRWGMLRGLSTGHFIRKVSGVN